MAKYSMSYEKSRYTNIFFWILDMMIMSYTTSYHLQYLGSSEVLQI